jgi:hypothetical protein
MPISQVGDYGSLMPFFRVCAGVARCAIVDGSRMISREQGAFVCFCLLLRRATLMNDF